MRVWPLIAVLTLAATGCAGLDLSGFDDEHLARLAENSSSSPTAIEPTAPDPTDNSPALFVPLAPPEPVEPIAPPSPASPINVPEPATPIKAPEPIDAPRPITPPRPIALPEPVESAKPPEPIAPIASPEPVEPTPASQPVETDQAASLAPVEPLDPVPTDTPTTTASPIEPAPQPQPPATILASRATPVEPSEPRELAMFDQLAGEVQEMAKAEAPERLAPPEPTRPQGTVIATVGPQAITLPELTQAIKDRIARLPGRQRPTRRLVIRMVQAEMEARILESLVLQQARVILDGPSELDDLRASITRQWADAELPRILEREGFASANAFDARLRAEGQCLDDLRSAYTTRTLARELMRREGRTDQNVDTYLDSLRSRFPIQSDLAQARRALARQ
ncbi:hypothetical protein [Tautonia marina]|uniref:hypothetical protein n=1 Tax=Tautonia marina TaxID=2653855 RepID=UPI0012606B8F|nr:hypothetical protein [Tautonia marina]